MNMIYLSIRQFVFGENHTTTYVVLTLVNKVSGILVPNKIVVGPYLDMYAVVRCSLFECLKRYSSNRVKYTKIQTIKNHNTSIPHMRSILGPMELLSQFTH